MSKPTRHRGGGSRRVSTTSSKLIDPESPVYTLASQFQNLMFLPQPEPLYVVLGTMAGNMLTGQSVWLMLVGPSSGGKTMLLKSLMGVEKTRSVSSIKGEAALLSGVKEKDKASDATGGLLRELGDNGTLIFMDFTSVLSKSREAINELLGITQELYDRTWKRDIGSEGGRTLAHTGRVHVIAGVTGTIDRQNEVNSEMGQRCLFYRMPATDGYQESMLGVNVIDPDDKERARVEMVRTMYQTLQLSFSHPTRRRELNLQERSRIVRLAQFGARARSGIPRDWKDRSVIDVPADELPMRMANQMTQLYLGMEIIGVDDQDSWKALEKITLDSMPMLRRMVLGEIATAAADVEVSKPAAIAKRVRVSDTAVRRTIEDLELLGLIRRHPSLDTWVLSHWVEERIGHLYERKEEEEHV